MRARLVRTMLLLLGGLSAATLLSVSAVQVRADRAQAERIETMIRSQLGTRGRLLTEGQALALRGPIEDNAFSDVEALVRHEVASDPELLYGAFVAQNGRVWVQAQQPGLPLFPPLPAPCSGRPFSRRAVMVGGVSLEEFSAEVRSGEVCKGSLTYGFSTRLMEEESALARREHLDALLLALATGLVFAGLSTVAAFLLARRSAVAVTGPLAALTEAARKLSAGQRDIRVAIESGDELEQLGAAFDKMVQDLDASYRSLEAMNHTLEQRVALRTAELEVALKELESFSYSVSHDLRAPLRTISAFAEAILEDHGAALPKGAAADFERIRKATRRMGELIEDLLRLSRVTQVQMEQSEVDLSALSHEVLGRLREQAPQREVHVSVAPGLRAQGDQQLVRVVLENLLGNAWKFTGRRQRASIWVGREGPVFFVRDDGAGFDQTFASRLFQPFQRLHRAEEFEGTGIGLATVARVVVRHGGRIWAESRPGAGATFFFTLAPGVAAFQPERQAAGPAA